MRYVVSTHSFIVIVDFDSDWQVINHILLSKGYHYGIALVPERNGSVLGKPSHFLVYRGGDSVNEQNDMKIMKYKNDQSFDLESTTPLSGQYGDIHQLVYANGGCYMANTKYNSLIFRDFEREIHQSYYFKGIKHDINHINSVYICGNCIMVILHNKTKKESEVAILEHTLATGFELKHVLSLWGIACHNIYCDGKHLYYNSSSSRCVVVVDVVKDCVIEQIHFKEHTKGMSVSKNHLVIGLSEHTFRDKRATSRGQLAIIDRRSLKVIRVVDLSLPNFPHPIGNINEVRCLSGGELAHSHSAFVNVDWNALRLARKYQWDHRFNRMKIKFFWPMRRMKSYLRQGIYRLSR